MTVTTFRTAAFAAVATAIAFSHVSTGFAASAEQEASSIKSAAIASSAGSEDAVRCYLLGCYNEQGERVQRPENGQPSASAQGSANNVAAPAAAAVATAKKKGGAKFHEIVTRHAGAHGVPVDLAHAVIRIESNYRVNARGRAGEVGLMQIKPATARMMGYSGSAKGLYDPETNIRYGMKYLAMAQRLGDGSVCGTILKYNAGHAAKRMNNISAAYCGKVKRHMAGA